MKRNSKNQLVEFEGSPLDLSFLLLEELAEYLGKIKCDNQSRVAMRRVILNIKACLSTVAQTTFSMDYKNKKKKSE